MLSKVPGWRSSRRFRLVDNDTTNDLNRFVAIHEYATENGLDYSPEILHARSTPSRAKIYSLEKSLTRRRFERVYQFGPAPRDLSSLPNGMTTIETTIPHDDYRLHYWLEGCIDDTSPVVIFCNGLNCDLHMWDPAIALLKLQFPTFRFLRYGR